MKRDVLTGHSDKASPDLAIFNQPPGDVFGRIDRYGKAYSLGRENDGCIHSDDFTLGCHQWSAGIAGIQGGIGLNHIVDQVAGLRSKGSAQCADNACRHGGLEAIGIPDGDNELSDPQRLRIAPGNRDQVWRGDAKYREIGFRIIPHAIGLVLLAIRKRDPDLPGVMDDMAVGENEAIRRKYKTRARAGTVPAISNVNIDNRWADPFGSGDDCLGIRIQNHRIGNLCGHRYLSMQTDYFCKAPAPAAIARDIASSKYLVLGR
jgi:hypothetical protein